MNFFQPPSGIRFYDIAGLAPDAVERRAKAIAKDADRVYNRPAVRVEFPRADVVVFRQAANNQVSEHLVQRAAEDMCRWLFDNRAQFKV